MFSFNKKIIYSKVYDSIEKVNIDVCNYLEGNRIRKTSPHNYRETLNQYIYFNDENKNFNLNDFIIEKIWNTKDIIICIFENNSIIFAKIIN